MKYSVITFGCRVNQADSGQQVERYVVVVHVGERAFVGNAE